MQYPFSKSDGGITAAPHDISKGDALIELFGCVDEVESALMQAKFAAKTLARSDFLGHLDKIHALVLAFYSEFVGKDALSIADVTEVDDAIADTEIRFEKFIDFSEGNILSLALNELRVRVRRLERLYCRQNNAGREICQAMLNRLSEWLFCLACRSVREQRTTPE